MHGRTAGMVCTNVFAEITITNWAHLHVQHQTGYQDSRTKYLATLPRKGDRKEKGEKGKEPGVKGDWKGDCDSNPKPPIIQTD